MTGELRVVVADDSVLLREGVASLLTEAGMRVVATAAEPQALLASVAEHSPDVAVVDIRMPPSHTTEGLRAARQIRASSPGTAILLVSQYLETRYAVDLFGEDARGLGYLLKQRIHDIPQFIDAVHRVAAGGCVVDPEIVSLLLGRRRRVDPLEALSEREREVLRLMAEGRSNAGIVHHLGISPRTVESHVSSILTKLGIDDALDRHRRVLAVLTFLTSTPPTDRADEPFPTGH